MSYVEETDEGITDLPTDTTDFGVTDTDTGLDGDEEMEEDEGEEEEEGEEEQSQEDQPIHYNTEDFISSWSVVEDCTVPGNILEFDHSYGYDCKRYFNLVVADENTVIFVSGNYIHFLDVPSQKVSFRRSALGGGLGSIVKNPNPEYQHIAIAENGQEPPIIIYEWPALEIVSVLRGGASACFTNLSYSPDGLLLVSQGGEPDNLITIWNWRKSRIMLRTLSSTNDVYRVVFSPSVPGHLTSCGLAHLKFWKMAKTFTGLKLKGELGRFGKTEYTDILGIYPMPDEKVVSGCYWGNILIWDEGLIKLEVFRRLRKKCHEKPIVQFDFKDGELWTISQDGHVKIWYYDTIDQADPPDEDRVVQMEPSYDFYTPNTELMYIKKQSYTDEDNTFYFAQDGNGGIWCIDLNTEADPGPPVQLLKCHAGPIADIATCPWGSLLCSLGKDGRLYIYNYLLKIIVYSKEFPAKGSCMIWLPIRVDPSGEVILLGFDDGVVRVGALQFSSEAELEFTLIQVIKPHKKAITAMTVNSDGSLLITGGEDATIFVLMIKYTPGRYVKLVPIGYVPTPNVVSCLTWHNESDAIIIVGCINGQIMQVQVPTKPVDYTKITYILDVKSKYQSFVTYKAQIRRDIKIAEINAKKKVKRDKKRVEMEKIMKDNPGLEIDEEVFLADSESDEELEPLYIPPSPNRILWMQHLLNDNFWLSMAGYDAGYVYQYHINQKDNIPLRYHMVTDADDTEISSYIYNDSKSFLILAMQDGRIRVNKCDPEDVTDLSDYWILSMHDNYNGFVPRMCFSFDERYFFSCGHDGNIFAYRFNMAEEEYIKLSIRRVAIDDTPTAVNDITKPTHLSLEQEIVKKEDDRKFKVAEDHKAEIRTVLRELRKAYTEVLKRNKMLLKTQIIPREDLEVDQRIAEHLRHNLSSDLALVKRKLAFAVEKSELAMIKMKRHYTNPLDVLPIEVKGIRRPAVVRTMRQRKLGKEFHELLELVEQKIIEAEIRGRAPKRASVVQAPPPPIVVKERPLEYFLLGLSPSTIQNKLGAKLSRLLYKYRQRKVKRERRQQEVTSSKNTREQLSQTDPVSSTSHPIHTPHHPLHHDRPAPFPFNPAGSFIDPIGPLGGIGRDVGRDDLLPAVGGGLLGGPGRLGGGVPDLGIFGGGGGMLFEPPRGGRMPGGPGNLGVPGGSIPPGARFDPFRPPEPDRYPGPPRRPNAPDNDEFGPPGWDDMYMWDKFNLIRPQEGVNHPVDVAALLEAESTIGDFKLKTALDYKVPKHLRASTVKKYKSLLLTRLKQFELRHEFNTKVYEMRDKKVKLRDSLVELQKELKQIHLEVPESMRKYTVAAEILINEETDFPERNLKVVAPIEENVVKNKTKPIVYGATLDMLRKEVLEFKFDRNQIQEELTPWEEEIRDVRGRRKLYEQDLVIEAMDDVVKDFDDELYDLWEERTKVMVDATFLDLHLLTLNQELIILKDFEANEDILSEKVHTTMQDVMDQQDVGTALTKQIENTKRTIETLQEEEKAVNQQFISTMSDYKFFDFLRRIFKKKYKPPKVKRADDSESDSDSSSDSSSDEEEDAGSIDSRDIGVLRLDDTVCPKGCDQAMYDLTFSLRGKRHGVELNIKQKQADLLTQKKDLENAQKKLKLTENYLKTSQEDLEAYQRKKQQKLNEVNCAVVISAHQIQNITPQNKLESINQSLIFSKSTLSRLYKRVGELQTETIQQKSKHKKNVRHLIRMNTDNAHMNSTLEQLKKKIKDIMKLKFGGLKPDFTYINTMQGIQSTKQQKQTPRKQPNIGLDEIEECVIKRLVFQLKMTMVDIRSMYENEMKMWQKKYLMKQQEHIESIRENTKRLELIGVLKREIRELSKSIDHQKAKAIQMETVLDIANIYKGDLRKLSIVVESQSKELEVLRGEIKRMRTKGMQHTEPNTFPKIEEIADDVSSDWSDYEGYFKKHNLYTDEGRLLAYFEGDTPPDDWVEGQEDELKTTIFESDTDSRTAITIVKHVLCAILSGLNVEISEDTLTNLMNVVQGRTSISDIVDDITDAADKDLTDANMQAIESSATQLYKLQESQVTPQERDAICQEILSVILSQFNDTENKRELGSILRELIESLPLDYLSTESSLHVISEQITGRDAQLTRQDIIDTLREAVAELPPGLVTEVQSFLKQLLEHVFSSGLDYLYVIKDEDYYAEIQDEESEIVEIAIHDEHTEENLVQMSGSDLDVEVNTILSEVMFGLVGFDTKQSVNKKTSE